MSPAATRRKRKGSARGPDAPSVAPSARRRRAGGDSARTLGVVSTFPPAVCGIGAYAHQQVQALEDQGRSVHRIDITPLQKGGWTLGRGGTVRQLFREAKACDELELHYQVWMYRDETRRNRLAKYLLPQLLLLAFLVRFGRRTTMVVHEYRYKLYTGPGAFLQWPMVALTFWLPRRLAFHTAQEVRGFRRLFLRRHELTRRSHHAVYRPRVHLTQGQARARLGLSRQAKVVLCIGFWKVHKGFPAFADTFARLHATGQVPARAQLHIVSSLQDDGDRPAKIEFEAFQASLPAKGPVHLHAGFQDDEAFDTWLAASDVVALPYKSAYSSGVAARARVLGRPLLVTEAGGLPAQAGDEGAVYRDEGTLAEALGRLLRSSSASR